MSMIAGPVTDEKRWGEFAAAHAPISGGFFYMPLFSQGDRDGTVPLEWMDQGELIGIGVVQRVRTPIGPYIFFAKGPVLLPGVSVKEALDAVSDQGMFVRFEPMQHAPWAERTMDVSPRETLLLDLTKSEEGLLSAMHEKTRYNIRLAMRKGVTVRPVGRLDDVWDVFVETARRDKFRLHPRSHYEKILGTPGRRMLGAYLGHELLAVGIFADAYSVRTYLHGASSGTHREVMAPYLLHWSAILDAKAKGLMRYDFWGISNTKPAFAGITRFKCGFGGTEVSFPGTFDHCRTYKSRAFYLVYILLRAMNRLFHA